MTRISHTLVAAGCCLTLAAAGCASSNQNTMDTETAKQSSTSSNDYASTDDQPKSDSASSSTQKKESMNAGPMNKPKAEKTAGKVSDAELKEFARVSKEMKRIQTEARKKIQNAESREEARAIQAGIQKKVQKVFDESSMSRERYEAIGQKMRSSPKLQKRYRQQMGDQTR